MSYAEGVRLIDDSINQILRAAEFAAQKHRDQRRKDEAASPYMNHPITLANILSNEGGISDPVVLVAALLHDTIEGSDDPKVTAKTVCSIVKGHGATITNGTAP
jgi:guanosine-3',5'-bis(diphosphate) 3'-pyrophosphohydrolase